MKRKRKRPPSKRAHNKSRREQYWKNEDYRHRRCRQARESYRKKAGVTIESKAALHVGRVEELFSTPRRVNMPDGSHPEIASMSYDETAHAIGVCGARVIQKWIRRGQLPGPILRNHDRTAGTPRKLYHVEEVEAMLRVFKDHQEERMNFYQSDTATIDALFARVKLARTKHINGYA